jgi:hypothetical protein
MPLLFVESASDDAGYAESDDQQTQNKQNPFPLIVNFHHTEQNYDNSPNQTQPLGTGRHMTSSLARQD